MANSASHEKNCTGTSLRMRPGMLSMSRISVANMLLPPLPPLISSARPQTASPPHSR